MVEHIKARGVLGLVYFHVPNSSKMGGKRTASGVPLEAIRLKRLGFRKGVSDLVLLYCGRFFVLELKAQGGRPSDAQRQFLSDAAAQGAETSVAVGLDAALHQLETWGLLRGRTL